MPTNPNLYPKVQFRTYRSLNEQLLSRITSDTGYNERAKKMIERHLWLLTNEYERLSNERTFSLQEELAIFDACKGTSLDERHIATLETVVVNAFRARGLASKWEVDESVVVDKVTALTPLGKLTLVDGAEQLWALDPEQRKNNFAALSRSQVLSDKMLQTALITFGIYGEAGKRLLEANLGRPDWMLQDHLALSDNTPQE